MKKIGFTSKKVLPLIHMLISLGEYIIEQNGEISKIECELYDKIGKNQNIDVDNDEYGVIEVNMRIGHYFLFDYEPSLLGKIKIDKNFKEAMKENILSIFEVIEHGNSGEYVILKDLINNTEYKIEGEFGGSDFSLNDLNIGKIVLSRFIKYDSKWFLLKNYYYLQNDDNNELINYIIEFFKEKTMNLYDVELIVYNSLFGDDEYISSINYYKRVINILKKYLTKKQLKIAISYLKNLDTNKCFEFIIYLSNLNKGDKFSEEIFEVLRYYMVHSGFTESEMLKVYFRVNSYLYKILFNELKGKSIDYKKEKFDIFFKGTMTDYFDNKDLEDKTYNKLLDDIVGENYNELEFN